MKKSYLLLIAILLIGLFFRTYNVINRFDLAMDGDLASWIVKDIVVNKHFRLVGQQTTAPGIFIGPLYYYLITPFYLLVKMDPIGSIIPITIIAVLTILSYYIVFSKLFNTKVGLISSFLYSVLLSNVQFDRWVAPTTPSNIWVIWYFYTIINITRGNYSILPLLAALIGLIWHIHIALAPTLIAIPVAMFLSKKLPSKKQVIKFFLILFIALLPLIVFEVRHNFQQTFSLISNFTSKNTALSGIYKFNLVYEMITKNINTLFFMPQSFKFLPNNYFLVPLVLLSGLFLLKSKLLSVKEIIPLYIWSLGVIIFFGLSSSPISEYYFYNIEIIFLSFVSLFLYLLYNFKLFGKALVIVILGFLLLKNAYFLITSGYYNKGYLEKKALVDYIFNDAKNKNFPCVGINYITTPGENVGFRYLFYLKQQYTIAPSSDVPVYNIVIPDELSSEVRQKFGHIGLIPPTNIPNEKTINKSCQSPNSNLTDSMPMYVE